MKYKGYEIEKFGKGFTVFFMGDEVYFDTDKQAKGFIDIQVRMEKEYKEKQAKKFEDEIRATLV